MSVGEYIFPPKSTERIEYAKRKTTHYHEVCSSSVTVNTFLSSFLAGKGSKFYEIVSVACVSELVHITAPVALGTLIRHPKLMLPLSAGTISMFYCMSKMSIHKRTTGSWWRYLFGCFGQSDGYQRVPTESDALIRSCSGSEEERVSAGRFRQECEEKAEAQRQVQELEKVNKELQIRISDREERIIQQLQDIEFIRTRLKEEEIEKQKALTRLSEHISLKLADNNPNIADLSDLNRPTKLAEKFSLLYDDQWTDAFDALQQRPEFEEESKAIKQLLEFLMTCFKVCREQADTQMRTMLTINDITVPLDCVSTEIKKLLKETRKKCASVYVPVLSQTVIDLLSQDYEELIKAETVEIYIKRCTELCWLMAVQDPPMALAAEVGEGSAYNKTVYREYTKSGPVVDYLVWPAVLIQDNGDLIGKGIVQCREAVDVGNFVCDWAAMSEQDILMSKGDGDIHYHNDLADTSDDKRDKADATLEEPYASGRLYTLNVRNNEDREREKCSYNKADAMMDIKTQNKNDKCTLQESDLPQKDPNELIQAKQVVRFDDKCSETKVVQDITEEVPGDVTDTQTDTLKESIAEDENVKDEPKELKMHGECPVELIQGESYVTAKATVELHSDVSETKLIQEVNADATFEVKDAQFATVVSSQDRESVISNAADHYENVRLGTDNCNISETDGKEAKTYAPEATANADTNTTQRSDNETVVLEEPNVESDYRKDLSD